MHNMVVPALFSNKWNTARVEMRINKFQLYPSLTKKLKVKYEEKIGTKAWSCNYSILPKFTPSVFRNYTSKNGRVLLANSR